MNRAGLLSLSHGDLVALILAQQAQVDALTQQNARLTARIAELEAKLAAPKKNSDNSGQPPSKDQKPNLTDRPKKPRRGRPGVTRTLADNPDRIIEARLAACPHCDHALAAADQPVFHAYDHVELPPLRPIITRIHRHRGVCPCCRKSVSAPAPQGFDAGSPFGPGVSALIIHLHVTQAIGFQRLARMMGEVFSVSISEGAIANILARAQAPLLAAAAPLKQAVRDSAVVGSDETTARIGGKTCWQWVLLSSTAICHVIADTRAASVVTAFLDGARPQVWVADRYGGQLGHGAARQMCLAHLLRDATYAMDEGCTGFAPQFKWLLLRAMAIGRRRGDLRDSTLRQYHGDLHRRLDRLLVCSPDKPASRRLLKAMRRDRDDLFRFVLRRDVPYTNNACERALRPSVIFRKVTGCFRSKWGAQVYAAAATVIATGRLYGLSALQAISNALAGPPVMIPP